MAARSFVAAVLLLASLAPASALAAYTQTGAKLVATGALGAARQGISVAVSADGNTALVGGFNDAGGVGAVWVYTRVAGSWVQGPKLLGSGLAGSAQFGLSVALSADGTTALIGGPLDAGGFGAAWVFTESGGTWTQQGAKLIGSGAAGAPRIGTSVALSADGNTALLGGPLDAGAPGATWVFTRSAGVWTQQGGKLFGGGAAGAAQQGTSVALSADGNTAMIGGPADNGGFGATWVFVRSGTVWSQQGGKLLGGGGAGQQGAAVALSDDGNTALVGGPQDAGGFGATWVFVRSGVVWTQEGAKLVGAGAAGGPRQGSAVALSADGNTALIGGPQDAGGVGASWAFTRSGTTWSAYGGKLVGTGSAGGSLQGQSVALSSDANTAIVGGSLDAGGPGATWTFADPVPAPALFAGAADIPDDQGGWLRLTIDRSGQDDADVPFPVTSYGLWRRVSLSAPGTIDLATALGTCSSDPVPAGVSVREVGGRIFASSDPGSTSIDATTFPPGTWEWIGGIPALQRDDYRAAAPTLNNSELSFYVATTHTAVPSNWSVSAIVAGQSVDNLAPAMPSSFSAGYSAGATHLSWDPNTEHDLETYRLHRGEAEDFVPSESNLIADQLAVGFSDVGPAGRFYKLSARDVNGNLSPFALVTPDQTTDVGGGTAAAFALERVRPNPASGGELRVSFALPGAAGARLDLVDVHGRRVATREVGALGAGRHTVDLAEGARIRAGLYWVRLTQGAEQRRTRVVVVQ